jgi:hypothetical protein
MGWYASDHHVHMIHGAPSRERTFRMWRWRLAPKGWILLLLAHKSAVAEDDPVVLKRACRNVSTPDLLLTWNMEAPKDLALAIEMFGSRTIPHKQSHAGLGRLRRLVPGALEVDRVGDRNLMNARAHRAHDIPRRAGFLNVERRCELIGSRGEGSEHLIGRKATVGSRASFRNGELTIEAPPTARLRISSDGHAPPVKSIFIDYRPLLDGPESAAEGAHGPRERAQAVARRGAHDRSETD